MKKILIMLLILIMIFNFTGCGGGEEHTYVVSKETCVWLFNSKPADMEENADTSPWVGDNYVSMEEDADGNLVIVLNDKHIEHWRAEILAIFEDSKKADERDNIGKSFELNEDYTEFVYYSNRELSNGTVLKIGWMFPYCGILQMLDGGDPNEWYVDIKVIDVETGITVKEGRMPDDGSFSLKGEDWDKALGTTK